MCQNIFKKYFFLYFRFWTIFSGLKFSINLFKTKNHKNPFKTFIFFWPKSFFYEFFFLNIFRPFLISSRILPYYILFYRNPLKFRNDFFRIFAQCIMLPKSWQSCLKKFLYVLINFQYIFSINFFYRHLSHFLKYLFIYYYFCWLLKNNIWHLVQFYQQ